MEKVIQAAAPSLPELFQVIALQVTGLLVDLETLSPSLREKVSVAAEDPSTLMRAWVNSLFSFAQTQRMLFCEFKVALEQTGPFSWTLTAESTGELIDSQRHAVEEGWTCSQAVVEEKAGSFHSRLRLGREA